MKIKLNWTYAKGELDTDTLKLICLPARGKRLFGATEDYLDQITCNYKDYKITHWKPINKPKGVEE
jgi:hypothetical protein